MKPETILVAVTMPDGLHITVLATAARGNVLPEGASWLDESTGWWVRPPTQAVIESELKKACPGALSWRIIQESDLPTGGRTYRNAWVDTGTSVVHDMPKARDVHRDLIRKLRVPALKELDAQWMRATGQGKKAEADAIESQRQALRDAPADPRIDAAANTEELKLLLLPGA
jgi:hypothetical protein